MSKIAHRIYITLLVLIVIVSLAFLATEGSSYYQTELEERFFHADHEQLKPSGIFGHGLGIIGTLLMIIGVSIYMARKRMRSLGRLGYLKHWLEFHIFLCTLGPIMVLFHTSFKFGGLVAISFWSMVAVFLSGIIGRFIYIQIPRTIEGRELSLNEIREQRFHVAKELKEVLQLSGEDQGRVMDLAESATGSGDAPGEAVRGKQAALREVRSILRKNRVEKPKRKTILDLIRKDVALSRRIGRLQLMQKLFRYWHVAHLPFAFVMLIIMLVHVAVTILFGYRWIF